jgi:hypothetical protein
MKPLPVAKEINSITATDINFGTTIAGATDIASATDASVPLVTSAPAIGKSPATVTVQSFVTLIERSSSVSTLPRPLKQIPRPPKRLSLH